LENLGSNEVKLAAKLLEDVIFFRTTDLSKVFAMKVADNPVLFDVLSGSGSSTSDPLVAAYFLR
jgi:hypothetical protein